MAAAFQAGESGTAAPTPGTLVGCAKQSYKGDPHCGDMVASWDVDGRIVLCIVDGLGHGVHAEAAAQAAVDYVASHLSDELGPILIGCDAAIRSTRGVAMALASVEGKSGALTYSAIGNIRAAILGSQKRFLPTVPGIVGAGCRDLQTEIITLSPDDSAIFCTDGVGSAADLLRHAESLQLGPQKLAETILMARETTGDDAAVLVYRHPGAPG